MNVEMVLKALDGKQYISTEFNCPKCKYSWGDKEDVTVKVVALDSLLKARCEPKDKRGRFQLCLKISEAQSEVALDVAEITMLKSCLEEVTPIILAGRLLEIIDPNAS